MLTHHFPLPVSRLVRTAALLPGALALLAAPLCAQSPADDTLRLHPDNPHSLLWPGKAAALITSAEHYGAALNRDFDFRKYRDALAADGLNYTRIITGSYAEKPGAFGIARNTLAPAESAFLAPWAHSGTPGYGLDPATGEIVTREECTHARGAHELPSPDFKDEIALRVKAR